MKQLTFGSLFAGVGGMDLGFERAGMRCAWQVEKVLWRRVQLAAHFPNVARHADIRDVQPESLASVDIVCGGFPCKQTSTGAAIHGKRVGLKGKDSGLWYEMLRVVRGVRPRWVVVENTAGAASWSETIKSGLASAGYVVPGEPTAVSASDVGAFHRRRRLFWIANRDGKGLPITGPTGSRQADRIARRAATRNAWSPGHARALRVADGVPGGVDRRKRIEAVGDAVSPPVAEWLGRRIVEEDACG